MKRMCEGHHSGMRSSLSVGVRSAMSAPAVSSLDSSTYLLFTTSSASAWRSASEGSIFESVLRFTVNWGLHACICIGMAFSLHLTSYHLYLRFTNMTVVFVVTLLLSCAIQIEMK
jgi:hypothetical protein